MLAGFVSDLFRRRVPHILGIYLAAGWGILEFVDWLVERYALSLYLTDLSLVMWASMIPTVLILAYFHGEKGGQRWTRVEKIGIPVNLFAAVAVVVFVFSGKDPSARAPGGSRITAGTAPAELAPTRIAVLYFDDESEEQSLSHLASAFTGALIDELTQVNALEVIPRGGVKPFRGASVSMDSLTRALGMGTLVEGSVSGSRERLIVSVSMIDPATQTSVGSFTLEGDVEEWLDLRHELAKEVARRLRQRLGGEIRLRERQQGTGSQEALALVERAEALMIDADQLDAAGDTADAARELARADELLARAESLDPRWVEPIVMRGWVASKRSRLSGIAPGVFDPAEVDRGIGFAEDALQLGPGDPSALELRGYLLYRQSNDPDLADPTALRRAAEQDLLAAVSADPLRAIAWGTLSDLHQTTAQFVQAKRDAERALEADPFLSDANLVIWRLYESSQELKEMDEAERWCDEGHRRFPEADYFVSCSLFLLSLPQGPEPDVTRAWALADTSLQLTAPERQQQFAVVLDTWVAAVLARGGHTDSASVVVERARAAAAGGLKPWIDYYAANVRLLQGEREQALALLRDFLEAIPQRKAYLASDWMFEDLWDDPGFKALVADDE